MKNKLLVLIGLFFCSYVNAEWNLITITDAITDDEKKTAIIKNDLGHTFSIYRLGPGGTVWVNFALSEMYLIKLTQKIHRYIELTKKSHMISLA
jgi:hypothetical protein